MTWTVMCEDSNEAQVVETFEEIEMAVERAIRYAKATHGYPTAVELSRDDKDTMGIVVGGTWSYAVFMYHPHGPALYSHQRELSGQKGDGPFLFMQFGSQGEADLEVTISPAEAWEALRQYFVTGTRPDGIPWDG